MAGCLCCCCCSCRAHPFRRSVHLPDYVTWGRAQPPLQVGFTPLLLLLTRLTKLGVVDQTAAARRGLSCPSLSRQVQVLSLRHTAFNARLMCTRAAG